MRPILSNNGITLKGTKHACAAFWNVLEPWIMSTDTREKFSSRLGFILVAAGCAIGLGNVWKFPYLCGQNGGAAFILIYLLCLGLLAFPILVCELSVGRASQKSSARAFHILEPKGSRWHLGSYMCIAGTYLLMMFYTFLGRHLVHVL